MISSPKYEEIHRIVGRIQAENPDINQLPPNQQQLTATIATTAAQVVLEYLQNGSQDLILKDNDGSPFPLVFGEWAQDYVIKTHFDRFLAIMLWLRQEQGINEITTSDIMAMYEKARWKKPANLADVFAKGAEKLYFTETGTESEDGLKQWRMTRTGYEYINEKEIEV